VGAVFAPTLCRRSSMPVDDLRPDRHTGLMTPWKCISLCGSVCHRRAATCIVMVLFAALAACQPKPPSPTPNPRLVPVTAPPGHISTLIARLTERSASPTTVRRTATASPTASLSATPTLMATASPLPLDAPVVVAVSLEEAEREVLSWLDPAREPRLEWSAYVRREALIQAGVDHFIDQRSGFSEDRLPLDGAQDPLLLVLASTQGMDPYIGIGANGTYGRPPGNSGPAALAPERLTVLGAFDALNGKVIGSIAVQGRRPETFDDTSTYRVLPTAVAHLDPGSRRWPTATNMVSPEPSTTRRWPIVTPTASPTAVPASAVITWATLPTALHPTFKVYGFAPGSSWTWQVNGQSHDVVWWSYVMTETIEAAWMEDGLAVLRSHIDADGGPLALRRALPSTGSDTEEPYGSRDAFYYISPMFIAGSRKGLETANGWQRSRSNRARPQVGFAQPTYNSLPPDASDGSLPLDASDPTTVQLPAGTFADCRNLQVVGGASWGSERWLCPGVGVVQYGFGDCGGFHCSAEVANLIRYHIADLPER